MINAPIKSARYIPCKVSEFDYVGVIFGEDLVWRGGAWVSNPSKNKDAVFLKALKDEKQDPVDRLRNVYRVLLTRGRLGTLVYFVDDETRRHFEQLLARHAGEPREAMGLLQA